jgi:hypothetical protein
MDRFNSAAAEPSQGHRADPLSESQPGFIVEAMAPTLAAPCERDHRVIWAANSA